jgi:hypothetical protein
MKRNTLVQIQSTTLPVAPGATLAVAPGTLPPSLVDPRRKLYRCAMTAIDQLEDGLKVNDRCIVREAHAVIRETGKKIKKHFCRNYRYPDPNPALPSLWSVLCTSGESDRPYEHEACPDCLFFDTSNNPNFGENHARSLSQ